MVSRETKDKAVIFQHKGILTTLSQQGEHVGSLNEKANTVFRILGTEDEFIEGERPCRVGVRKSLSFLSRKAVFTLDLSVNRTTRTESTLHDKFRALPISKARTLHAVTTGIHS